MIKAIFLVGPIDTGKMLTQALAGEVTKTLKSKGKATKCSVYEIHASLLLQKELKDIVKEAEKSSPCLVVIDELDWLFNQKSVDPKIWSDLVTSMSGTLKSAKKQVFIVGTARNCNNIDMAIKDHGRLGTTIYFDKPNIEERTEFFQKEISDSCVIVDNFDILSYAKQTEGCSQEQLRSVIKGALNIAHSS